LKISFRFTPHADPADGQRLMQYDLSCLTRWISPCQTKSDIMPTAGHEMAAEH